MEQPVLLLVTLSALLLLAAGALVVGGGLRPHVPVLAVGRAALQLAAVTLVLGAALTDGRVAAAFVVVMLAAVSVTAGRRLGGGRRLGQVLLASTCGAAPALALLLGVGAFPRSPRYVISFAGIVLGATMTVCTLAGRRLRQQAADRWPEVEGWLALGATPRQAVTPLLPGSLREALLPGVDQTRTTGLVTLPGAFVGALAGGASAGQAAQFQVAILTALLAAQAVSGVVLLRLLAPSLALAPASPSTASQP